MTEPRDWTKVEDIRVSKVEAKHLAVDRTWSAKHEGKQENYKECIWPAYVPTPAQAGVPSASASKADQTSAPAASAAVAASEKYWSEAATQARSTAKWIATVLAAALAAVIGTAPLTPLNGKDIDWEGAGVYVLAGGIALLGVTLYLVISVLVPGITTFADLMADPGSDPKLPDLSIRRARMTLARQAKSSNGVLLPIGVESLAELGHRVRLEELTLSKLAEEISSANTDDKREFWSGVKVGRGQILQCYLDEVAQWVMVASYVGVKVRTDRARTVGLALGLAGAVAVVWGYIELQPSDPTPTAKESRYVVLTTDSNSSTRTQLGKECDAFDAVPLDEANEGKIAVYVTGGKGCATGRFALPADEIATVASSSPSPTPLTDLPSSGTATSTATTNTGPG